MGFSSILTKVDMKVNGGKTDDMGLEKFTIFVDRGMKASLSGIRKIQWGILMMKMATYYSRRSGNEACLSADLELRHLF